MGKRRPILAASMLLLCLSAQNPAPKEAPAPTPADEMCKEGEKALAAGKKEFALSQFQGALWIDPRHAGAWKGLVACGEKEEDRIAWASMLAEASADERGAPKFDAGTLKAIGKGDSAMRLNCQMRADAARELAAYAAKLKAGDPPILARWTAAFARDFLRRMPALDKKFRKDFEAAIAKVAPKPQPAVKGLQAAMDAVFAKGDLANALLAARILRGFAQQSSQKDLESPAPEMSAAGDAATKMIEKIRAKLRETEGEPLTLEKIQAMSAEEKANYNKTHQDPANPAIGISPTGLYRVETANGIETLAACLEQVELHHHRLATWFGKDPFEGRQGLVRIVPEGAELEREGAPYWWAAGFQSGDVTTIHFDHGRVSDMGRILTHELTHRFDQAVYPGIPGWLAEGRAVWTGDAYGSREDTHFAENFAKTNALSEAHRKNYGDPAKLTKLVTATLEEYRDNYTAGHALWVFLSSWKQDGKLVYADRLPSYMDGLSKTEPSLEWFELHFADGKQGRPNDFELFAATFGEFAKGFWFQSPGEWAKGYIGNVPSKELNPFVYDAPTWHRQRQRAEPFFAENHAADAGKLLAAIGTPQQAIMALELACDADEPDLETGRLLAGLYEKNHRADAAWALRDTMHRLWPDKEASPGDPPVTAGFRGGAMKKIPALYERCELPHSVAAFGLVEDKLRDYDDMREEGRWTQTSAGDLIVGRGSVSAQSGKLERSAYVSQSFVRGKEWMEGCYSVSAHIKPLTAYADGAMIVGYTRRDRQLRLGFSVGDHAYATGTKSSEREIRSIQLSCSDLRARDGALSGVEFSDRVSIPRGNTSFHLEALVQGPWAHVYVNGQRVTSYRSEVALPIAGFIGFASGSGVLQVDKPTVQFHKGDGGACACRTWPGTFDLEKGCAENWERLAGVAAPAAPRGPLGALVLWSPTIALFEAPETSKLVDATVQQAKDFANFRKEEALAGLPLLIDIPEDWSAEMEKTLREGLAGALGPEDKIFKHKGNPGFVKFLEGSKFGRHNYLRNWIFYIDPDGILRVSEEPRRSGRLPDEMLHWVRVNRGR